MTGKEYQIYGYKGKQVRDQIHSHRRGPSLPGILHGPRDVVRFITWAAAGRTASRFWKLVDALAGMGYTLKHSYQDDNRVGDHICYISDLSKTYKHFPNWKMQYDLPRIIGEIVDAHRAS